MNGEREKETNDQEPTNEPEPVAMLNRQSGCLPGVG